MTELFPTCNDCGELIIPPEQRDASKSDADVMCYPCAGEAGVADG